QHRRARREVDVLQVLQRHRVAVGELLDLLGDLVQRRTERLDVLALDRGDEAVHQRLADLVGGLALELAGELERVKRGLAVGSPQHFVQGPGRVVGGHRGLLEQRVELVTLAEHGLQGKHRDDLVVPCRYRTAGLEMEGDGMAYGARCRRDYDGLVTDSLTRASSGRWRAS